VRKGDFEMTVNIETLSVGSDPEVFVKRIDTGEIIGSQNIVPGTKHDPFKTEYGYIQRDNVLAEFNTEPAYSKKEFVANVKNVLKELEDHLNKHGCTYDIVSSHILDYQWIYHPEALQFGCDPDYDAWRGGAMDLAIDRDPTQPLRSAGGHVHIGVDGLDITNILQVVRACDLFLAVPSVLYDDDTERRKLYGGPGKFRPKTYGVEYRTLSNFWLKDDMYIKWVYDQIVYVLSVFSDYDKLILENSNRIKECITTANKEMAKELIKEFHISLPGELGYMGHSIEDLLYPDDDED
jgi:hypothetical protein